MRCKKGQFYLIAAIIIILVIAGFVIVSNYARRKSSVTLYDLGEELGIESQNVLDYGSPLDETEMNALWQRFIEDYRDYAGEGKDLYFIFGDPDGTEGLSVVAYEDLTSVTPPTLDESIAGKVVVRIEDIDYEFDLVSGQNFYFVVSQEIDGDKYVAKN